jgi:hypothetical protein
MTSTAKKKQTEPHKVDFSKHAGVASTVAKEFSKKVKGNKTRADLQKINKPKTNHGKMSLFKTNHGKTKFFGKGKK